MKTNPTVCVNKARGLFVYVGSPADTYRSEVRAYDIQLACLRKKLAALKICDACYKIVNDAIDEQQRRGDGDENWLKRNFYE
jgi:hypothetical protein